jgi:chemosensory pili system protein ChpA (sensor histidine kinase/response regulator)
MMNDMMALLRDEFAQELPATQETLALWRATPRKPPESVEDMLSLFERFSQAVDTVGLQGLSAYLLLIQTFTHGLVDTNYALNSDLNVYLNTSTSTQLDDASQQHAMGVRWLSGWTDQVNAYLEQPADPKIVEDMVAYLVTCPKPFDEEHVLEIAGLLLTLPNMSSEHSEDDALLDIEISDEDVELATDDVDPELLFALLADAPQQLDDIEHAVTQWRAGRCTAAAMQNAMRSAHTLKGSGNIIGLPGIGKLAHRLEDILEYAVGDLQTEQDQAALPKDALARDVLQSVHCLQQMVSHLQGNEVAPNNAKSILQSLFDWVKQIRSGDIDDYVEKSATEAQADAVQIQTKLPTHADVYATSFIQASEPVEPIKEKKQAQDTASLRLGVGQLSRLLRRAGQSIVQSERFSKLLQDTDAWLTAMERNHQVMATRLNELEAVVNSQVSQLREQQQTAADFDPLELDRYDALHGLSRFIGETARDGSALVQQARESTKLTTALLREEGYALREQHRELLTARMVPVKTIIPRLKRTVAQTAAATGRKVALQITGEDVVVDADVLSRLADPLLHLLRNAVDHGIELPHQRVEADKPELGNIYLDFQRHGEEMVLRVSDDGRGLNLAAIEAKALNFGLIEIAGSLSESELQRLILQPGFSTREQVTETSGRGVGMDIVNDRINGLKGRLDIDSAQGLGSTFTVHVPVSSGVAHALVVQCAGETVALPLEQVGSIVAAGLVSFSVNPISVQETGQKTGLQITYGDDIYPAFALAQWLDLEELTLEHILQRAQTWIVVLAKGAMGPIALLVDEVLESRELILQDVGILTRRVRGIIGGALRADGKPLFLIGVSELQRAVSSQQKSASTMAMLNSAAAMRKRLQVERTRVLVVDDAWSVRRSMQQLLEDAGYDVATAADGFEALERLRVKPPAVVLTDLEMPNMNGLELTRRMQEIPQWAAIPVVMITSRASAKHREEGRKAGVDVYLTKPYLDADLIQQVRTLTGST